MNREQLYGYISATFDECLVILKAYLTSKGEK